MRAIAIIAALAACEGKPKPEAPPAVAPKPTLAVVKVSSASVLAIDDGKPPPPIVIVDDPSPIKAGEDMNAMKVRTAAPASWAELATATTTETTIETVDLEERLLDLADNPEALDEGDMAKSEPHAYEGKVPPPVRRAPGRRGPRRVYLDRDAAARQANVIGEVQEDGRLGPQRMAVIASPKTNAQRLARVLYELGAALVVEHAGTLRPLRIDFTEARLYDETERRWIELRVANGMVVEAVSETPIEVKDLGELAAAIEKARASRKLGVNAPVDVLFDPAIDAQRLVDLLVALDAAKVKLIGLGALPDAEQMAFRGRRVPTLELGELLTMGNRDRYVLQREFRERAWAKLRACFVAAHAKQPELEGHFDFRFFILVTGKITPGANTRGMSNELSACVLGVVNALEFPPSDGGQQVHVEVIFRS